MKQRTVHYRDLLNIPTKESGEQFVSLCTSKIRCGYRKPLTDMQTTYGNRMWLRKSVRERLTQAQNNLQIHYPDLQLFVTYGYRSLKIQQQYFMKELSQVSSEQFFPDPIQLYEHIHTRIAVPAVSGHPTGGAIDIIIVDKLLQDLEFGSSLYDLSNPLSQYFARGITDTAKTNRQLLRKSMMEVGFAPFDGEWWHFSYGDKEWACYYEKPYAIYDQVDLRITGINK